MICSDAETKPEPLKQVSKNEKKREVRGGVGRRTREADMLIIAEMCTVYTFYERRR